MDKSKAAASVFDKLAKRYESKYMDTSMYHDTFDTFCNNITNMPANVLDIACGPGNVSKYLLDKRPDMKLLGIDLAPNMITLAQKNNPDAEFAVMDCREISQLQQKYDGIMCGFALPYLIKEEAIKMISDAANLLNDGGILYVSTMEEGESCVSGYQTSSEGDTIYIHYHRADYLMDALEESDLNIIDTQRKKMQADGSEVTDLILIAKKAN